MTSAADVSDQNVEEGGKEIVIGDFHQQLHNERTEIVTLSLPAGRYVLMASGRVVKPEKASFFPAVLRNGVETSSSSGGMGFNVTAAPGR